MEEALSAALYQELEATFPKQWILKRIQQIDAGSPTRRLEVAEDLQWDDRLGSNLVRLFAFSYQLRVSARCCLRIGAAIVQALGSTQLHKLWRGSVTTRELDHTVTW